MQIKGVFEVALKVKELEPSTEFYVNTLGFEHGLLDSKRRWHFLWVNGRAGMIVLQEDPEHWQQQHFAFTVDTANLSTLKTALQEAGVEVTGPVDLDWMNAKALYFEDPDGHALEFTAL